MPRERHDELAQHEHHPQRPARGQIHQPRVMAPIREIVPQHELGHGDERYRRRPDDRHIKDESDRPPDEVRVVRRLERLRVDAVREEAPQDRRAGPPRERAHGVGEKVVDVERAIRVRVVAPDARELRRLDQKRRREAREDAAHGAPAKSAPRDEAERDEERHVGSELENGRFASGFDVRDEAPEVELRRHAAGDAEARRPRRQRVQREAHEAEQVEDGDVGADRRPEAQPPVAVVEKRQDGQREHERRERPQRQREREVRGIREQKMHEANPFSRSEFVP